MKITVDRKELNEKENYTIEIENDKDNEVIAPDDEAVIELFYEILKDKDLEIQSAPKDFAFGAPLFYKER